MTWRESSAKKIFGELESKVVYFYIYCIFFAIEMFLGNRGSPVPLDRRGDVSTRKDFGGFTEAVEVYGRKVWLVLYKRSSGSVWRKCRHYQNLVYLSSPYLFSYRRYPRYLCKREVHTLSACPGGYKMRTVK